MKLMIKVILLLLLSVGAGGSTAGRMAAITRVHVAHANRRCLGYESFLLYARISRTNARAFPTPNLQTPYSAPHSIANVCRSRVKLIRIRRAPHPPPSTAASGQGCNVDGVPPSMYLSPLARPPDCFFTCRNAIPSIHTISLTSSRFTLRLPDLHSVCRRGRRMN